MKYAVCMTIFGKSQFLYDQIMSILNQAIPPSQLIIIEDYSGISSKNYLEKILFDKKIPYKILVNKTNAKQNSKSQCCDLFGVENIRINIDTNTKPD